MAEGEQRGGDGGLGAVLTFAGVLLASLLVFALAQLVEGTSPLGWLSDPAAHFERLGREAAMERIVGAAQVVAGVLAILITVVAIVVELAANRYTHRITQLYIREPVNVLVLGFYVLTTAYCLWLSATPPPAPDAAGRPYAGFLVAMGLVTGSLMILLPYFGYLFQFVSPLGVIERIRRQAIAAVARGAREGSAEPRREVIGAVEELEDVARSAREHSDRGIALAAIDALEEVLRAYRPLKPALPPAWFEIDGALARDPDFVSMAPSVVEELRRDRVWLETKVFRQYLALFAESLGSARDLSNLIALNTREFAVEALAGEAALVRLALRFFNSYLRAATNARDPRTAYYVLHQYRLVAEAALAEKRPEVALEVAGHLRYYGQLGYTQGQPFLLEVVAYDVALLVERAVETNDPAAESLLDLFLQVDRESASPEQEERLRGVRRAQVQLATFLLARGDEASARRVFEDLAGERPALLAAVRAELESEEQPLYWEFNDRGVNFSYLPPERRALLGRFYAWFDDRPPGQPA
jgi:hypothetical protein